MLNLKIVTPERTIYENDILQISIPTMNGEITVLPHHIPLISVLAAGELKIKDASGEHLLAVSGGFIEIQGKDKIVVLADHAERVDEIDIAKTEEAAKKAEEQMKKINNVQDVDYARLQAVMDRELNKVKIAKKYRNLPPQ